MCTNTLYIMLHWRLDAKDMQQFNYFSVKKILTHDTELLRA